MLQTRDFPCHPSSVGEVRKFILQQAATSGIPESSATELTLAVHEAFANAMIHTDSRRVRVSWVGVGSCAEVRVIDEGHYRSPTAVLDPNGFGLGVPIMMAMVDEFSIRPGTHRSPGTVVRLMKCWEADGS